MSKHKSNRIPKFILLCSIYLASSIASVHGDDTQQTQSLSGVSFDTVVKGLKSPWAMAFLPNGDMLVTERSGSLKIVRNEKILGKVADVPEVYFAGQGGLLDVMLDQDFAKNSRIYLSFSHGKRSANATRLISAKLVSTNQGYSLKDQKVLFTAQPMKRTGHHHGARIAQLNDGSLIMTVGDGYNYREQAQTLDNHFGKIIRVDSVGTPPADNPFIDQQDALPEIYSFGHRNQQGLAVDGNRIYQHEHGPKGGDEVNIIEAGTNYGWPVATFGIDYNGASISPFTSYEGMRSPTINWTPSIAPSSMALHNGFLYVTTLAEQSVRKLSITDGNIIDLGIVYKELNTRLRDIASAPDGHLYIMTDGSNGKIIKVTENSGL